MPVVFTDHNAVIIRIAIEIPLLTRGRGYWRMNIGFMKEKAFRNIIKGQWEKWKTHKRHYQNAAMWWDRYTKRIIKQLFIEEGTERKRDRKTFETFFCEKIYSILKDENMRKTKTTKMKELKERIVRLHHIEQQKRLTDMGEQDKMK
jgi:hypothetical protein